MSAACPFCNWRRSRDAGLQIWKDDFHPDTVLDENLRFVTIVLGLHQGTDAASFGAAADAARTAVAKKLRAIFKPYLNFDNKLRGLGWFEVDIIEPAAFAALSSNKKELLVSLGLDVNCEAPAFVFHVHMLLDLGTLGTDRQTKPLFRRLYAAYPGTRQLHIQKMQKNRSRLKSLIRISVYCNKRFAVASSVATAIYAVWCHDRGRRFFRFRIGETTAPNALQFMYNGSDADHAKTPHQDALPFPIKKLRRASGREVSPIGSPIDTAKQRDQRDRVDSTAGAGHLAPVAQPSPSPAVLPPQLARFLALVHGPVRPAPRPPTLSLADAMAIIQRMKSLAEVTGPVDPDGNDFGWSASLAGPDTPSDGSVRPDG